MTAIIKIPTYELDFRMESGPAPWAEARAKAFAELLTKQASLDGYAMGIAVYVSTAIKTARFTCFFPDEESMMAFKLKYFPSENS